MISSSWQMQLAFQRCHQHPPTVLLEVDGIAASAELFANKFVMGN